MHPVLLAQMCGAASQLVTTSVQSQSADRQAELEAYRIDQEMEMRSIEMQYQMVEKEAQRQQELEVEALRSNTELERLRLEIAAHDSEQSRQASILNKMLDLATDWGNRKLDFIQETYASARDLLKETHQHLLREIEENGKAYREATGPMMNELHTRIKEIDRELEKVIEAQMTLSNSYSVLVSKLEKEIGPIEQNLERLAISHTG